MKIVTKVSTLNNRIQAFAEQGKARATEAHTLAVSCLNHANEHGDLTLLTRLYHSFGKTENPAEFRYWLSEMSGKRIKWDKEQEGFAQKSKEDPVLGNMDIERAKKEAWWDMQKVKENREFNPEKDAKGVASMLERHAKEARQAGEDDLAETYEKMANQAKSVVERLTMLNQQKKASVVEH